MEKVTQEQIQEATEQKTSFEIRGFKDPFFRIPTHIAKDFFPLIGPYGIAVYTGLSMYANNGTQQAWPSYQTMADLTGMSRREVIRVISRLEFFKLIKVERREHKTGVITFLDPTKNQAPGSKPRASDSQSPPSDSQSLDLVTPRHPNYKNQLKEQNYEDDFHQRLTDYEKNQAPPPKDFFKNCKTLARF